MKTYEEWEYAKSDSLVNKFIDKNYDDFKEFCEEEYSKEEINGP